MPFLSMRQGKGVRELTFLQTAASTALRSLVGSVLPLAGPSMYSALGLGWGNSILAFIALALCGVPLLFARYGAAIRTHPRFQVRL